MYDKGRCTEPDLSVARKWYKTSAENGFPYAQFNYGVFLYYGKGGPKDEELGLEWFRKSADQGFQPAISALQKLDASYKQ